jgi:UDP-GlcNAc:undecaprenyl-phosphate GlcNAc-1-phosphate transferase
MTLTLGVAGFVAFLFVALLTPMAGVLARRLGLIDVPKESRAHNTPTPYLGGVSILVGIFGAVAIVRAAVPQALERQLIVILVSAAAIGAVGLLDDWRPHPPRWRLLVEVAAAVAVILVDVRLSVTPWEWLNMAITVIWIVGIVNATNLLDNMDGLASGAVAIAALGATVLGLESGQRLLPIMGISIAGASLGFLVHNRPPARIFMGDTGALSLGFLLAVTVAKLDLLSAPGPLRLAVVMLLCGVGILDTALVVVSRLSRHRSPFQGGTDHSSHRLVRAGMSPVRAVLVLHAMSGWFVASAILLRHSGTNVAVVGGLVLGAIVLAALWAFFRMPAEEVSGPPGRALAGRERGPGRQA